MEPSEVDAIVQRLVANPHDEGALAYAHHAGESDPKSYALMLERLGNETPDPLFASHWLSEAANVWINALGDAHRAARVLMTAIDKDPTQQVAADLLAQLYRDKGDLKALVALLDRRTKALAPLLHHSPELKPAVAGMHEELGRLWNEVPLLQPRKAVEHYKRAAELDPQSALAIFSAREIMKSLGQYEEVWPLYDAELALENDPARRVALLRDEASTRTAAGDLAGATKALGLARKTDDSDPALQQEFAASVLDRVLAGEAVPPTEKHNASELLVGLAEVYDGEHGLAYAKGALDIDPAHDRALQLYVHYARMLQQEDDLALRYHAYVVSNRTGAVAKEAVDYLAASYEAAGRPEDAASIRALLPHGGTQLMPVALEPPLGRTELTTPIAATAPRSDAPPRREASVDPGAREKQNTLLEQALAFATKGRKPDAYAKFKEVLAIDPSQPEALSWVEDYLRAKRDYGTLRDVLVASVRANGATADSKNRLREIAGLCETNLRDLDGAINAYKQLLTIDRVDEGARQALTRIFEKAHRWDDLANLLEQDATAAAETETKISLEKKLATLHELKRNDFGAAAESWSRIVRLTPEDDTAIATAAKLFEKAGQPELAAQVIAENVSSISGEARATLLKKLAELREPTDPVGAGEAYSAAADATETNDAADLWSSAERAFAAAGVWERASHVALRLADLAEGPANVAKHHARAAEHYSKAGQEVDALFELEQAAELDPETSEYGAALENRYSALEAWDKLAAFSAERANRISDTTKRIALRRQAANVFATHLGDLDSARENWTRLLEDGDDAEALTWLADDSLTRNEPKEATEYLERLVAILTDPAEKARVALREAELLADAVGDIDTAVARYETILTDIDPASRAALQAVADLEENRENFGAAAVALERELKLVDPEHQGAEGSAAIAERLSTLYEKLGETKQVIRVLDILRVADPDDWSALERLCDACEQLEQWDRVAELLAQRIGIEGDEDEAAEMTLKLSSILYEKLNRGDEALAAMTDLADQGQASLRTAYVELADKLGWKGIVAAKLVEWFFDAPNNHERMAALNSAFERFCEVGRDQDAARVAIEIIRSKGGNSELALRLETIALKIDDYDALALAQDSLLRDLSGPPRAEEFVRQAEVRSKTNGLRAEAVTHGEEGLTSVPATDAEPLLARLAAIAQTPKDIVDIYERQVSRTKQPADRVMALTRAAQIAGSFPPPERDRALTFFELALSGVPQEETLAALERAAREGDEASGGDTLRRALCTALVASGGGARDGGRTRATLLRRAAALADHELRDLDLAFKWLQEALIAHVDAAALDAIEALGVEQGDVRRVEAALTQALAEVFDGPLVRLLVARRAKLRRDLGDREGAAADLKKLHDLSPADAAVLDELSALLRELGDYKGLVQVYEDQILRGKDVAVRAELARTVAHLWEEHLADPREAADAWRRVLRMKAGDAEATAGLERAKSSMLRKPVENEPAVAPQLALATDEGASELTTPGTADEREESISPDAVRVPVHTPAAADIPKPGDTAAIVAALSDSSETLAYQVPPKAEPDPNEDTTAAMPQEQVLTYLRYTGEVDAVSDPEPVPVSVDDENADDEEILVVDDLAEIIDEDEDEEERPRTVPPPLPLK